jgi:hypothetical protein
MTVVTMHYRYKPPPRKRKTVPLAAMSRPLRGGAE